ncbi:spermidine synthase [Granulicella rosea]|nr:fused MFS/spermidine synthase [Granulicella rosea]
MAAKQLLPVFGGSAAVWITCLVFFQAALLAGYLYAHLLERRSAWRGWIGLHVLLLAGATCSAAVWAFGAGPAAGGAAHPSLHIFASLGASIGIPFLLLGSTSPLLQVWLGRMHPGGVPYRLFGLSNLASLLALVAYPSVIEPYLALRTQRTLWFCGVLLFAAISAVLSRQVRRTPATRKESEFTGAASHRARRWMWFLLPMAGAMQLSAVTAHLTVNVAAIPLLWILPLAAYLATFVIAFQYARFVPRTAMLGVLAVMLISLADFLTKPEMAVPIGLSIGLFLVEVFVACLFCHTELYALRPARADEATGFYLMIAAGGAAGSALIGIVAPLVFRANYDLSLTFVLTAALALAACWQDGPKQRLLWGGCVLLLVGLCVALRVAYLHDDMMATRNFYGSLSVKRSISEDGEQRRTLMHGTIVHGTELFGEGVLAPAAVRTPTTYYAPDSGIGLALGACCGTRGRNIGVVGLGAGTLAAYGRAGDRIRFYEINPAVPPIARNLFTYIRESPAQTTFAEGDARASLAAEPAQRFDVLVVDAFSGDAIPLHLLTLQALAIYRRHLAPGGVLAFHISNQYIDLKPELAELALATGMQARSVASERNERRGEYRAVWVLLADNDQLFRTPELAAHAEPLERNPRVHAWTDDYSSLMPLIRW